MYIYVYVIIYYAYEIRTWGHVCVFVRVCAHMCVCVCLCVYMCLYVENYFFLTLRHKRALYCISVYIMFLNMYLYAVYLFSIFLMQICTRWNSWEILNDVRAHQQMRQRTATLWNTLNLTTTHCNTLQKSATHCNTLQRTATHCNTLHHA